MKRSGALVVALITGSALLQGTATSAAGRSQSQAAASSAVPGSSKGEDRIDVKRARALFEKSQRGVPLTPEEQKYLDRARRELKKTGGPATGQLKKGERSSVGLKPLTEMTATDRYKGEDGGLYGGGKNQPPAAHQEAAREALKQITPRDAEGKPAPDGLIGFLSIGMSNTAGAFLSFKELADRDPHKSPRVVLVNGAVGGAGAGSWTRASAGTWTTVAERLKAANVSPAQVQVMWIKHAEPAPEPDTFPLEYAKTLRTYLGSIVTILRARYPNLRIVYLSSRTYGGYNAAGKRRVNPEPFAYESAFSVRWLILDQMKGTPALNHDPKRGVVVAPVLLWGPYLWADGITPRKSDGLVWERRDMGQDGVHPSPSGRRKIAELMLTFFKTDPGARTWFVKR
jgi:hypothetical protein